MISIKNTLMTTAAMITVAATPLFAEMTTEADASISDDGVTMQSETSVETNVVEDTVETAETETEDAIDATEEMATDVAEATERTAGDLWDTTKEGAKTIAAAAKDFGKETVSEIVGTRVMSQTGEDIGEIDALVEVDGEAKAIVGVGGFLGIGEHDVLIEMDQFAMVGENSVMLDGATESEIESMPEVDLADYTEIDGEMSIEDAMAS
ncbi:PRC-barrel domain-containing protein [Celeribacter litoreus]|uniref:PRC-barrel domain-containing protein n=1 Tax=Celeribacter litoreus TaxID=2876714 RepID=UPI001CCA6F92|nr:PRC-barrel domain-containing protein [Celeribacter litoreus]MCA0043302.1 PRC-barrel domain-containing protein [Celeribacter litoreus]